MVCSGASVPIAAIIARRGYLLCIRWAKGSRVRCFLLAVLLTQLSTFNPQLFAAITFTNAVTISETNTNYDGQDIIVDGATVTIEWSTNFTGNWQTLTQNFQSNLVQETGAMAPNLPMRFFRAIRGTHAP